MKINHVLWVDDKRKSDITINDSIWIDRYVREGKMFKNGNELAIHQTIICDHKQKGLNF